MKITLVEKVYGIELEVGTPIKIFSKEEKDEYLGYFSEINEKEIIFSPSKYDSYIRFTKLKNTIPLKDIARIEAIVGIRYYKTLIKKIK